MPLSHTKDGPELSLNDTSLVLVVAVLKLLKMATGMRALLDTVVQALPQVKETSSPKDSPFLHPFSKEFILVESQRWWLLCCAGNCLKVMSKFSRHSWVHSSPQADVVQVSVSVTGVQLTSHLCFPVGKLHKASFLDKGRFISFPSS